MTKNLIKGISRKSAAMIGYISIYLLAVYVYKNSNFIEIWGYYGFNNEYSTLRLITTLVILCFLSWCLTFERRFSVISLHAAVLLIVIPSCLLNVCAGASNYFLWATLCGYMTTATLVKLKYKVQIIDLSSKRFSQTDITKIILVIVFGIIVLNYSQIGRVGVNFDIMKVYDLRSLTKDLLPTYLLYLNSWAAKAMIPFCVVMGLTRRSYFYTFIGIAFGVLLFSVTGHKATLIFALLTPLMYFFAKSLEKRPQLTFLILVLTINTLLIASFFDFHQEDRSGQNLIGTFLFRRALLIPALLNSFYIETFGISHSYNYFTDKIPSFLGVSPINIVSIPSIVGYRYFNSADTNANTGWIGSGFAQAGFLGVLFYSSLMAFIFRIADVLTKKHGLPICLCVLAGPCLTMISSSDVFTGLITHGGFFAFIMLMILPQQNVSTKTKN